VPQHLPDHHILACVIPIVVDHAQQQRAEVCACRLRDGMGSSALPVKPGLVGVENTQAQEIQLGPPIVE
jgi:hypothetical protein